MLSQSSGNTWEIIMIKLFNLRSFRLLSLGGAKSSTYGEPDGDDVEIDETLYFKP